MDRLIGRSLALALWFMASVSIAQEQGVAKPELVLRQLIRGMPKNETQEVRIMTASFKPGDRTVFHTHRFPVAVYILDGTFTLELQGRSPTAVKAGEGFLEPPNVKMIGFNQSSTEPLRLVIFYVSDPGTPFLDPAH